MKLIDLKSTCYRTFKQENILLSVGLLSEFSCRYRGKRMRIDYFLVSEKLKDRILKCKMHGRGIELEGELSFHLLVMCKLIAIIQF